VYRPEKLFFGCLSLHFVIGTRPICVSCTTQFVIFASEFAINPADDEVIATRAEQTLILCAA
jgi:hypothetical protein